MSRRRSAEEIEAFCQHFAAHGNKAAAIMNSFEGARAWGSDRASTRGWALLKRPAVAARVKELRAELAGAPPAPPERQLRVGGLTVFLSMDDLEVLADAVADARTDQRLRMTLARLVADGVATIGRRANAAGETSDPSERKTHHDDAA